MTIPPFRADHVGSLLRPPGVHAARQQRADGEISAAELRAVEDEAIADAVRKLEATGMRSITDGEFRRAWFHLDFLQQLDGVVVTGNIAASSDAADTVHMTPPKLAVTGSAAPRPRHPGRRLRVPRVPVAHRDDAQGVHPLADDGPLPRRAGGDRHRGVPRPRRLLRRPGGLLPRRDRRPPCRRLPLPAARRHQPRLSLRPGDAPRCRRPRRRPGHAAAHVRRADQRGAGRAGPRT